MDVSTCTGWAGYQHLVAYHPDRDGLLDLFCQVHSKASSGERVLLEAALAAADFEALATKLGTGSLWERFRTLDGETARAVAAVIERRDDGRVATAERSCSEHAERLPAAPAA